MDLKDFRTGIETLSRYTNQQKKVADPFLVQVGKDGKVSLVSGNAYGTTVWRTGVNASIPAKHGVDSKTLVQAVKAIKGRGVTVSLKVSHDKFVVEASTGGAIELPYIDVPSIIHRPTQGDIEGTIQIGNLDLFARKMSVADNDRYPFMSFEQREDKVRVISTDGHTAYEADMVATGRLPELSVCYIGFWDALRGATTHGEARFVNGGLQLHHAPFEFYTGLVEGMIGYKSWWDELFPKGQTFDVAVKVNRKELLDALKKDKEPLLTLTVDKDGFAASTSESLTRVAFANKRGNGVNYFVKANLVNILSALEADTVVLAWNKTEKPALLVRHELAYECFILAPVVRPT